MAKITLFLGNKFLREVPLVKERMTIGRRPHNDLVLDDIAISGEHAVIVTVQPDSYLEDLNSTNGTQVNGQPVKKHYLRDDDCIELAQYRIRYSEGEARKDISTNSQGATARLLVLNGAKAGSETSLTKAITSIGRLERHTAVILKRTEGFFLAHADANSPTLLNGVPLGNIAQKLQDGDVISIDGDLVRFVL